MASYKDYKTVAAAKKAGSLYFMGKDGKKKLAVTAETLNAWKKKNKGKFKGSALTAWANNKGKDIKGVLRPKKRPGSGEPATAKPGDLDLPKVTMSKIRPSLDRSTRDPETPTDKVKRIAKKALKETNVERKKRLAKERQANYDRARKAAKPQKPGTRSGNSKGGMMKKKKGYAKGGVIKRTKR